MWYHEAIFYQIYPLGFCGAPPENDGAVQNRIEKLKDWIAHIQKLGVSAVYLCPVFESGSHGYDTQDYTKIDGRLGSSDAFAGVCESLHSAGLRVVLDGVFNHVGRGFWAFRDVLANREGSAYKDWFQINFSGNSPYNDGLWYEGWEGHFELVKLNLHNPRVVDYLFNCVRGWVEAFGIDGLRLDVAYLLPEDFLRRLRSFTASLKPDFFLLGEAIHGDYNRIVNPNMLDSCTNYECFKGIHSSFNERNLFEIAYSLNRQFGPENWTLYKGLPLFNFVDNHDVARIASNLRDPNHLRPVFGLLFGMPGVPCIYYGSEWGAQGQKVPGNDAELRPCFSSPAANELTQWVASLGAIRAGSPALQYGGYRQLYLTNSQYAFLREYNGSRVIVAVNADGGAHTASVPVQSELVDLHTGQRVSCPGRLALPPYSAGFYQM